MKTWSRSVKAHPAHPGTSELVAGVIQSAVARLGFPEARFRSSLEREMHWALHS